MVSDVFCCYPAIGISREQQIPPHQVYAAVSKKARRRGGGLSHAEMKHGQTNRERFWRGVGAGETLIRIICIMIVLKWEAQNSRPYL